ncbi:efflux RND transporter periplasmic adaptor subunit [Aporhodopirellula aestuarii]|uniref:Biotin/lipoyl-binding protein n=1 Tax=Aporhodopirellula aestuarii TaxID=2950107 RepID=A0ABT0U9C3_9BACT|nr:biotin/lipoyl-binding protein [Aporhodopirellula aestuarii]MCM2373471.1 biotin/lipoyl-binding protein [Aporhodopirellula aestuarii]
MNKSNGFHGAGEACNRNGTARVLMLAAVVVVAVVAGWFLRDFAASRMGTLGVSGESSGLASDDSGSEVGRVDVAVIVAGELTAPLLFEPYRGEIRARRSSSLSMRRSGRLAEVLVHEGDTVEEGEVLARLDVADLDVREMMADAELAAAVAAVDEAIAGPREQTVRAASARVRQLASQLASAERRLERQELLSRRSAGTEQELDDARYAADELRATLAAMTAQLEELQEGTRQEQIAAAKANVAAAQAAREQIDVERADSQIVAPYSGVIAIRYFDEGEMIGPSQGVLKILESDPLEARFGVPPQVCRAWQVGDRLWVSVRTPAEPPETPRPKRSQAGYWCGIIVRMQPQVDEVTRTRGVDVELTSPAKQDDVSEPLLANVHIGQTATLWVPLGSENAGTLPSSLSDPFWVPTESLVRGVRGLWSVYVAMPDHEGTAYQELVPSVQSSEAALTSETLASGALATIQRREIQVLRSAGPLTLVHGMLTPGEWIVSEGVGQIGPGVSVRVRPKTSNLSLTEISPGEAERR